MSTLEQAKARWRESKQLPPLEQYEEQALRIFEEVRELPFAPEMDLRPVLRKHPRDGNAFFSKNLLVRLYARLVDAGRMAPDPDLLRKLRMKPVRTLSGVATVTVLTKPYPCPGRCIFCPTDVRMPKSYLHDEPGAQRAEDNDFDPYLQVRARLDALATNGHIVDKVELLILGGTWSAYKRSYQRWFVQRCLDAMNECDSRDLEEAQHCNEGARHRNVGLVIETRPDHVKPSEIRWLRSLGVTKVQMGAQSLDDAVLSANHRGHTVEQTAGALELLRAAGFKLVLHWMPNLLGATPQSDRLDFGKLWEDGRFRPDEIKIYPCSLLPNAELYEVWERGGYQPYADGELIDLVADCKTQVPEYCRINRVYRDIPATNIVAGSKLSNLRESVRQLMESRGQQCRCIRCHEVRGEVIEGVPRLVVHAYETSVSEEQFLTFEGDVEPGLPESRSSGQPNPHSPRRVAPGSRLLGFLRLSLGNRSLGLGIAELDGAALVREVHVYGRSLGVGDTPEGDVQHRGLGTRLLREAEERARARGFRRLAVIASVGTRRYYASRGYALEGTYMVRSLLPGLRPDPEAPPRAASHRTQQAG